VLGKAEWPPGESPKRDFGMDLDDAVVQVPLDFEDLPGEAVALARDPGPAALSADGDCLGMSLCLDDVARETCS